MLTILVGEAEGKKPLGDIMKGWGIILRYI
jgi:hypothetical protein